MDPTTSPSTETDARDTLWRTALMGIFYPKRLKNTVGCTDKRFWYSVFGKGARS